MAKTDIIEKAKRLHTHRVVFTANDDVECAVRALLGQSTRAISKSTGLSESQVQYRVSKAGIDRWAFRNGETPLATKMIDLGYSHAQREVVNGIAPKFARFAA